MNDTIKYFLNMTMLLTMNTASFCNAADDSYKTAYEIPAFKALMGTVVSHMDVTLEQGTRGTINISGHLEWLTGLSAEDLVKGGTANVEPKLNTWGPGARHTLKGKLEIEGYNFVSDRNNPLVFRVVRNRGYVYESGQGTVATPAGEKILLRSAKQVELSPEQAKSAESAIKDGSIDTFREMLKKDPKLATGRIGGQTLLHMAAFYGQADMVRLLIEHGVDVNAVDRGGNTPLFDAVMMKSSVAARVLLEKGANVNAVDYLGETPLHRAAMDGVDVVRLLLDFGARVDLKNGKGETPIKYAIQVYHVEAVKLLGEAKGDLDGPIADYTKAILLDPNDATLYQYRGCAKQAKGDVDGAIEDWNKGIELHPSDAFAYYNRGVAKQAKDDLDGARTDFKKVLELQRDYPEAQKRLDELNRK